MNVFPVKPSKAILSFRHISTDGIKVSSYRRKTYIGIGDKTHALMSLSDRDFMDEINRTRKRFVKKFPQLSHLIFEYKKQCTLLDLDFWYERPVPKRCEKYVRMDIMTLMNNVDIDSEEGKQISQLCNDLLRMYIVDYDENV